ncbi:MAG: glycosyltransferase family 2 protein [Deltaproteobacteria bacterium]|nr:glycosyltransferase family 2 protein [Deltaproteobacteria bacterium]
MTIPVSVVMPVYNSQDFLPEAIESILSQTFRDFEFIIVDDCSTDNSAAIALDYQKRDARIRIHHHEQNTGIVGARNTGLELAQGKYIAWMDSDDVSMPERLAKQFLFMQSHPEVGITSTNAIMIDEKGNSLSDIQMPQTHILITWAFCFYDPIINPAVMANRELCSQAGGYRDLAKDKTEYFPEDYDLWIRLSNQTHFYNFNEVLLKLRKHGKNITSTRLQSTLRNSSLICRAYLQSMLGREIPQTHLEMVWGIANPPRLRGIPQLIEKLYSRSINLPEISPLEKQLIREDAAMRLIRMAVKYPFDPYSLPVLRQALKINPKFHIYLFEKLLRKASTLREKAR